MYHWCNEDNTRTIVARLCLTLTSVEKRVGFGFKVGCGPEEPPHGQNLSLVVRPFLVGFGGSNKVIRKPF